MSQGTESEHYRPLDVSQSEVRLLSFENSSEPGPLRLRLHYASLIDWKPEYVSFRDQKLSTLKSTEISEAWADRFDFTLETPSREIFDSVSRFTWGDYICLSYTWGDPAGEKTTVFLNDAAITVHKDVDKALRDLRGCTECQLGMKVWVDALCINQADVVDRNAHVLRVKDIFGMSFSVSAWVKDPDFDSGSLHAPGENLLLCDVILREYGRQTLEELFGIRERQWGVDEERDEQLVRLAQGVEVLAVDHHGWVDSDDEDDFGIGGRHLRDLVDIELSMLLREDYWTRLWIIQELAVSPTTSMVRWGDRLLRLSTVQAVGNVLLPYYESQPPALWQAMKPRLDLLTFTSTWTSSNLISELEPGDAQKSSTDATLQSLNYLALRAKCSLPHDRVYGVLGLFSESTVSAVTVDYHREPADVIAEFSSIVPEWEGI